MKLNTYDIRILGTPCLAVFLMMGGIGFAAFAIAEDKHKETHEETVAGGAAHDIETEKNNTGTETHDAHEGEHEEAGLRLTDEQRSQYGISVKVAGPDVLRDEIRLPGEVIFNEDQVVHLVPRVPGIVREVFKTIGDTVTQGELLATIDSRELADTKAGYMSNRSKTELAEITFQREKELRGKGVSSEQDFLDAQHNLAERRIELRSAEQKLHALGLSGDDVRALTDEGDQVITRYEIRSPIDGTVTSKHISLGESISDSTIIFTVVDLRSTWVNLTVYSKHLSAIKKGNPVVLKMEHSEKPVQGTIAMITPFLDESTRSATARIILDNSDGEWIPGTFVTGIISVSEKDLPVVVPRAAVQNMAGKNVVFIEHEGSFETQMVELGRSDSDNIEIVSGLNPGTTYVATGAFEIKATLATSNLGSHAGHGH